MLHLFLERINYNCLKNARTDVWTVTKSNVITLLCGEKFERALCKVTNDTNQG